MSDLAKLAGVSKSTVSRALAGSERVTVETRERIQKLAKEHNYRMNVRARNFRLQEVSTFGVLLPSTGRPDWLASDPFVLEMLGSISDALEQAGGHELLLAKHSSNDPAWIEDFASTRSVDGIIVIGQSIYHQQLNSLAKSEQNMVVWGAEMPDQNYVTVGTDNIHGGYLATKHLIGQGRTRIMFIGDLNHPEIQHRRQGYLNALEEAGLEFHPHAEELVISNTLLDLPAFAQFLDEQKPDAIFASVDMLAISCINAMHKKGLSIPTDIAVVGYDNIILAQHVNPALTTVKQDARVAGHLLVEKLLELINEGKSSNATIPVELIVRESSEIK
ncbi:MAG: LacI family transcriptional regulator [Arenicella sp.]|nr:LacI family transcriptional regulator [Arenicella sp.]